MEQAPEAHLEGKATPISPDTEIQTFGHAKFDTKRYLTHTILLSCSAWMRISQDSFQAANFPVRLQNVQLELEVMSWLCCAVML